MFLDEFSQNIDPGGNEVGKEAADSRSNVSVEPDPPDRIRVFTPTDTNRGFRPNNVPEETDSSAES